MAQTLLFKTYWEAQSLIQRILRLIGHILNSFLLGGKTILSGKRKESLWKSMQDILEMTISSYQGNLRLNLSFAFKNSKSLKLFVELLSVIPFSQFAVILSSTSKRK